MSASLCSVDVLPVSSLRGIDSGVFRRRFCYCVTNQTSDLTGRTVCCSAQRRHQRTPLKNASSLIRLHRCTFGCDGELHQSPARTLQVFLFFVRWGIQKICLRFGSWSWHCVFLLLWLSKSEERLGLHLHLCDGGEDGYVETLPHYNQSKERKLTGKKVHTVWGKFAACNIGD